MASCFSGLFLRIDSHSPTHLLPRAISDLNSAAAAGLFLIFSLNVATISFSVYGAALLQRLYGASPDPGRLHPGRGDGWTLAALIVAGRGSGRGAAAIGVVLIALGQTGLMFAVPHGSAALIAALTLASGTGWLAWSFVASRIVANTPDAERALASGSVPTASMIGAAVESGGAGAIASGLGPGREMSLAHANAAGFLAVCRLRSVQRTGLHRRLATDLVAVRRRGLKPTSPSPQLAPCWTAWIPHVDLTRSFAG